MPATEGLLPLAPMRRVHYFTGRLLTAEDLQAEQDYHRDRLRRHNLALHAAGVAQGLTVTVTGGRVQVTPGLALDCMGREICVPVVAETSLAGAAGRSVYVVVSYSEQAIDLFPVPGIPDPSGGDAGAMPGYIEETYALSLGLAPKRHQRRGPGWAVGKTIRFPWRGSFGPRAAGASMPAIAGQWRPDPGAARQPKRRAASSTAPV